MIILKLIRWLRACARFIAEGYGCTPNRMQDNSDHRPCRDRLVPGFRGAYRATHGRRLSRPRRTYQGFLFAPWRSRPPRHTQRSVRGRRARMVGGARQRRLRPALRLVDVWKPRRNAVFRDSTQALRTRHDSQNQQRRISPVFAQSKSADEAPAQPRHLQDSGCSRAA
jgi:hypothetical protein